MPHAVGSGLAAACCPEFLDLCRIGKGPARCTRLNDRTLIAMRKVSGAGWVTGRPLSWLKLVLGLVGAISLSTVAFAGAGEAASSSSTSCSPPPQQGYWLAGADGGIFSYGGDPFDGSAAGRSSARVVGVASLGQMGYWITDSAGHVYAFGCVHDYGSLSAHPAAPIVGIAAVGEGYYLVGADGGVFSFGVPFYGSAAMLHLAAPIVGIATIPGGYWLLGADGGVFSFGQARYWGRAYYSDTRAGPAASATPCQGPSGAAGACTASSPTVAFEEAVGIGAVPDGGGYWIVGSYGGVHPSGDASYLGDAARYGPAAHIVGISASVPNPPCPPDGPSNEGYYLVGADGGVFAFGTAQFHGSAANHQLAAPIVGITAGYGPVAASCPAEPVPGP